MATFTPIPVIAPIDFTTELLEVGDQVEFVDKMNRYMSKIQTWASRFETAVNGINTTGTQLVSMQISDAADINNLTQQVEDLQEQLDNLDSIGDLTPQMMADLVENLDDIIRVINGVTSHSLLAGLEDDDHPQYLTNERGDARYPKKEELDELVQQVVTNSVVPVAPGAMLDYFLRCDWWLAPRDADYYWTNRGVEVGGGFIGGMVYFPDESAVDFRQIGLYAAEPGNGGGVTIPIVSQLVDEWTVAFTFRWDNFADVGSNPVLDFTGASGLSIRIDNALLKLTANGVVSSIATLTTGVDYTLVLTHNKATLIPTLFQDNTTSVDYDPVDMSAATEILIGAGNTGTLFMDAQLGDIVVDSSAAWSASEQKAASSGMAMRWDDEGVASTRRGYEASFRGVPQAGLGLRGTSLFQVAPDDFSGPPFIPVNVGQWGVSVDARRTNGYWHVVDRQGTTAKIDAGYVGTFVIIDSAPELRPVPASYIGYCLTILNNSSNDIIPTFAGAASAFNLRKTIRAGDTVVAMVIAENKWILIGGVE